MEAEGAYGFEIISHQRDTAEVMPPFTAFALDDLLELLLLTAERCGLTLVLFLVGMAAHVNKPPWFSPEEQLKL